MKKKKGGTTKKGDEESRREFLNGASEAMMDLLIKTNNEVNELNARCKQLLEFEVGQQLKSSKAEITAEWLHQHCENLLFEILQVFFTRHIAPSTSHYVLLFIPDSDKGKKLLSEIKERKVKYSEMGERNKIASVSDINVNLGKKRFFCATRSFEGEPFQLSSKLYTALFQVALPAIKIIEVKANEECTIEPPSKRSKNNGDNLKMQSSSIKSHQPCDCMNFTRESIVNMLNGLRLTDATNLLKKSSRSDDVPSSSVRETETLKVQKKLTLKEYEQMEAQYKKYLFFPDLYLHYFLSFVFVIANFEQLTMMRTIMTSSFDNKLLPLLGGWTCFGDVIDVSKMSNEMCEIVKKRLVPKLLAGAERDRIPNNHCGDGGKGEKGRLIYHPPDPRTGGKLSVEEQLLVLLGVNEEDEETIESPIVKRIILLFKTLRDVFSPTHCMESAALIGSLPGLLKQWLHCDYVKGLGWNNNIPANFERIPFSMILALFEPVEFWAVHPATNKATKLVIPPGGFVLFSGSCLHAGAGYNETSAHIPGLPSQVRIHCYFDTDSIKHSDSDNTFVTFEIDAASGNPKNVRANQKKWRDMDDGEVLRNNKFYAVNGQQ